jgi:(S)-2-hydroxyglutarate dehydrogenase
MRYDFIVVGGGIVGAATARQLQQSFPGRSILLIEKEARCAAHQTGRNSGVIHAGVYYTPGSLKARFCKAGAVATFEFCREHNLPAQRCGKLLVATNLLEIPRMRELEQRCAQNGIACEVLDAERLHTLEPMIAGLCALRIPATGMTSYAAICDKLLELFVTAGGEVGMNTEVLALRENPAEVVVTTTAGEFRAQHLTVCAGVMADRLVRLQGLPADFRIVPFRGEYFRLRSASSVAISHHIYPLPDPALPFLGIHLTRMIDGAITVGPNAVLAPGLEAYRNAQLNLRDLCEMAKFLGFWRLLPQYWTQGLREIRNSLVPSAYLSEAQKYCPQLRLDDFEMHPPGIRAQAIDSAGRLLHDFVFVRSARTLHVCNAPSPAATSALPIAHHIAEQISANFPLI